MEYGMRSNTRLPAPSHNGTLRVGYRAALLALSLTGAFSAGAQAQIILPMVPAPTLPLAIEVEAVASDKVALLHGLAMIEGNVQLVMLFAHDDMVDATGKHIADLTEVIWPEVKDGLLAAGGEDFSGLLQQLAEAKDGKAMQAVASEMLVAVVKTRSKLGANDAELGQSVLDITREAAELLNASGPTEVGNFQDAWALVNVARTEVDLLMRAKDPVIAKAAVKIMLALDDVILAMPDPAARAPVDFDRAIVTTATTTIETLLDGAV